MLNRALVLVVGTGEMPILSAIHRNARECITFPLLSNHFTFYLLLLWLSKRNRITFFFWKKKLSPTRCCRTLVAVIANCSSSWEGKRAQQDNRSDYILAEGGYWQDLYGKWNVKSLIMSYRHFTPNSFTVNKYV